MPHRGFTKGEGIKRGTVPNRPTVSAVHIVKRAGNTYTCQKDAPQAKTALKKLVNTKMKTHKMPTGRPSKLTSKKDPKGRKGNQSKHQRRQKRTQTVKKENQKRNLLRRKDKWLQPLQVITIRLRYKTLVILPEWKVQNCIYLCIKFVHTQSC